MNPRFLQQVCYWSAGGLFVIGIALVTAPTTSSGSTEVSQAPSMETKVVRTAPEFFSPPQRVELQSAAADQIIPVAHHIAVGSPIDPSTAQDSNSTRGVISQAAFEIEVAQPNHGKFLQLQGVITPVEE